MDPGSCRNDTHQHVMERSVDVEQKSRGDEGWRLVDVLLSGGAPWGFTLRGGREHHEPLLITKVEEGSKAAAVSLQVGDELVNINEVPLSGYRQEAICLVKGSHKTLALVVKRNMKMVDIVAQKMPSENDVHVARSFLTKILRSSMRKNRFKGRSEPISRPHSWHSTKFNESQLEIAKTQPPPTPAWHTDYDASSSSNDLSTDWEQTNLRRVSDQYSSLGSMDSLEQVSHPYPSGQLSPAKFTNSVEHLGGGKRDSAYSSFSTSSGTPDYTLSKSNAASTENVLYKVSHWDSGGKHGNGRPSQNTSEGIKQDDRPGYLQMPGGTEEQAGSRHSSSSRASFGPVWHVPEKKKTTSPSPPPPPPPVRSDSFVATKVHERGLVIAYPEAPDSHIHAKPNEKGPDKRSEASENAKRTSESRHSHVFPPKSDKDSLYISPDNASNNQLHTNKQYSLSTTDVRLSQPPHVGNTYYQWQYGDKSTFYSQPRTTSVPKPQNVSGYYSSMHELPTNNSVQFGGPNQGTAPAGSLSAAAINRSPESAVHSRYYSVASCQPVSHPLSGRMDDRKSTADVDVPETGSNRNSVSIQADHKGKYLPPQQQQHFSHRIESNGHGKQDDGLNNHHKLATVTPPAELETPSGNPGSDDRANHRKHNAANADPHYMSPPPSKPSEPWRPVQSDVRHLRQEKQEICPKATPMLHSLSMETSGLPDHKSRGNFCEESIESNQSRRSDRFATTLRNEIQMRRAKLQKSMSAATLVGTGGPEEDQDLWRSKEHNTSTSADGSFTSTYKDNLKEAQARVLKATSFRRRDLEPVLVEHSGAEPVPNYPSSVLSRKDVTPLPTVSESMTSKSGSAGAHVTRIGGRKRFSAEKKVKSFSEPDKMHEVGMKEDLPPTENRSSFAEQWKVSEAACKPTFAKPMSEQSVQSCSKESKGIRPNVLASNSEAEDKLRSARSRDSPSVEYSEEGQEVSYSVHKHSLLEQQRLGTFAEYEARWSAPETKASERYLSADNILDPGTDEKVKPHCFHGRSRSSPSADFYRQVPVLGRKSAEYYQLESNPAEQFNTAISFSERPSDCRAREQPVELERYPAPPILPVTGSIPEYRHRAAPVYDRPTSISHSPLDSGLPPTEDHSRAEARSGPRKKAPERPPLPKVDSGSRRWEITPPLGPSLQSLASSRTEVSPDRDPNPAHVPAHSPGSDSEQTRGTEDQGRGAGHRQGTANPEPANPEPANPEPANLEPANPEPAFPPLVFPQEPSMPAMDEQQPPSPQFSPQRLSDKPPVSLQEEDTSRIENVIENSNTAVKKVPIKIVHSESASEKESRQYLVLDDGVSAETQGPRVGQLGSLGAPEQDYSVFCAYTRHKEPAPDAMPPPEAAEQPGANGTAPALVQEDQKREELARDIMGKDKSLADILDQSKMKTTMDLMEGIFPQGEQLLEGAHQRRKAAPKQSLSRNPEERKDEGSLATAVGVVTSSAYYSTSAPKAELLIKMKDMQEQEQEEEEEDTEDELDIDLANKKQELIDSLSKKLQVLREARESLQADILDNNALGDEVEATVQQVCKPNELDKFRMFVGDLDKVVSLLLSLSGRLARVENALNSLDGDAPAEERRTLTDKRKLLIRQHEDAKELKENLDRREGVVYDILASHLDEESLTDYEHFVKMKSALIIEQRKLEDKIKLGEEQLKCLTDSLPIEQRLPL